MKHYEETRYVFELSHDEVCALYEYLNDKAEDNTPSIVQEFTNALDAHR